MKILFYGLGPMSSLYAARLRDSGQDVTVLARGRRLADLREHGIVLEEAAGGRLTTTRVKVVEELGPEDAYDLVVVLMRKNRVSAILPTLARNRRTPNVLFMGNNAAGPDEMIAALGRERVLLGFPGAGGFWDGHVVRYEVVSGREQPTTFGEPDGRKTPRVKEIAKVFKNAGFPVAVSSNMDAWLKTHAAEICPVAAALYMTGTDNYRLARTRDGLVLLVRAMLEGYRVLKALGVPITPAKHRIVDWLHEPLLVAGMRRMVNTKQAEATMVGHAEAARDEFILVAEEFKTLARKAAVPTPAIDRLYTHIDPAVPPVEDGSAGIPMKWGGTLVGAGGVAALVLALTLLV